ncbi:hypothetical protein NDU88_003181 [Pleurodeles waltl]|uniref:ribonuclease H n=1 Tax=Pleurodeles waltl TaxID=8319 RepID=A0AAV7VH65_PLEWA|nr:hypothetical protein NDU88_003181 [Pleurodeles waltl]
MLELGVVEPSTSPWCSPVVLVPKPDGTIRFCIDFRKLNEHSMFDTYPIPRVDDVLEKLGKAKYMSTLDLTKGYWKIPLAPEDKEKTAFSTQSGLYQFTVLPFGLHGAPATFQRLMDRLLKPFQSFSAAYLDDVVIFSETWDDHLLHLQQICHTLENAGLTANPKKCVIGKPNISYLGYEIGQGTLQPQTKKIIAILNAPNPKTKKDLRSFLGLVGYYRRFIPDYSTLAAPLTDLLSKSHPNRLAPFSEHQKDSFEQLKFYLTQDPILKCPDFAKPFHLYTDASDVGLGGVLAQPDEEGRDHPIVYISRKLFPRERNYPIIERECLAIKWAVDSLQYYLLGRPFILFTDHAPLTWLSTQKDTNSRILRWFLELQPFSFQVRHIPGPQQAPADYLSRFPGSTTVLEQDRSWGEVCDRVCPAQSNSNDVSEGSDTSFSRFPVAGETQRDRGHRASVARETSMVSRHRGAVKEDAQQRRGRARLKENLERTTDEEKGTLGREERPKEEDYSKKGPSRTGGSGDPGENEESILDTPEEEIDRRNAITPATALEGRG